MADFTPVLTALCSADNHARTQAEKVYEQHKTQNPSAMAVTLVNAIATNQNPTIRTLSCVLLRRIVQPTSKLELSPESTRHTQQQLLKAFVNEPTDNVRRKICHAVAPLAARSINTWPELLPSTFQLLKHQEAGRRESAFFLVNKLCEYADEAMFPHSQQLYEAFTAGLKDQTQGVRIAALQAGASFLLAIRQGEPAQRAPFEALLGPMFGVISGALNSNEELATRESLKSLIELARVNPAAFRGALDDMVRGMFVVGAAKGLDPPTRKLAVEMILTIAEQRPGMARRSAELMKGVVPLTLGMMFEVDGDEWDGDSYDPLDEDLDSPWIVGAEALSRLSESLGKVILQPLFQALPALAKDADWKKRRACAAAVIAVTGSSSCVKVLKPQLASLVMMVGSLLGDAEQQPRYYALEAIGRMAQEFGGAMGAFYDKICPALVACMGTASGSCERVRGHAAAAATCLADPEEVEEEQLAPYLSGLLGALCGLLQGCGQAVQEESLTAVARLAAVAEADFGPYYGAFMPGIKQILGGATALKQRPLRAKAIECLGLMAEGVGMERFGADAEPMMKMLLSTQAAGMADDDPQMGPLLRTCVRICKCMGQRFVPYLPHVIPPLLATCVAEVNYAVEDVEDGAEEKQVEADANISSVVLAIRGVGNKRIALNTSIIEEKLNACNILRMYAECLGGHFMPFVGQVLQALLPLVDFTYFDGVRSAAALALPRLLACSISACRAAGRGQEQSLALLGKALEALISRLTKDMQKGEVDSVACLAEAIKDCLCHVYRSGGTDELQEPAPPVALRMPLPMSEQVTAVLMHCAGSSVQRRMQALQIVRGDEFCDEEMLEQLQEELEVEDELMSQCVDGVGYLLKSHKAEFGAILESKVLPLYQGMLKAEFPTTLRVNAICVFDDLVEHGGPALAAKYIPMCLPVMMEAAMHEEAGIRQAAIYGIGQCAAKAPAAFAPLCEEVLKRLRQQLARPDARSDENCSVTDNVVGAIGRIAQSLPNHPAVKPAELLALWLAQLPLKEDEVEARYIHRQLCELTKAGNPALLGAGQQNLPRVAQALVQALTSSGDLVDAATTQAAKELLTKMPQQMLQQAAAGLTAKQQQALQKKLA